MMQLPEPRRFARTSESDEMLRLVRRAREADALARPRATLALRRAVQDCLEQDNEPRLQSVLAQAEDALSYRLLCEALARSVDSPLHAQAGVIARSFALPIVLVAAASQPIRIPGRLDDIRAVQALFERHNALGPMRNFGLSNALCGLESLQALSPVAVFHSMRGLNPQAIGTALPPEDIVVAPNREQTHLRFIVGAGVTSSDAPGFTETAAHIGRWGRDCAQALSAQLVHSGLQLLALPRPPRDLVTAPHAGRFAQLETALNLFATNAVRRLRSAVGEPAVIVSAHEDADIRITLSSPFALDIVEGFRWPLHPLDDIELIERVVKDLFADMRVTDVRVMPRILPAQRASGVQLYPRSDEWDALCAGSLAH